MIQAGRYTLNGHDLWATYGILVLDTNSDWLQMPPRKDSVKYDYPDQNGISIDLTAPVYKDRDLAIKMLMSVASLSDFNSKWPAFLTLMSTAGTMPLVVADTGRTYQVYYKNMSAVNRYGLISSGTCYITFTLTLSEPQPNIS